MGQPLVFSSLVPFTHSSSVSLVFGSLVLVLGLLHVGDILVTSSLVLVFYISLCHFGLHFERAAAASAVRGLGAVGHLGLRRAGGREDRLGHRARELGGW